MMVQLEHIPYNKTEVIYVNVNRFRGPIPIYIIYYYKDATLVKARKLYVKDRIKEYHKAYTRWNTIILWLIRYVLVEDVGII